MSQPESVPFTRPSGDLSALDAVWRANELAPTQRSTVSTGFAELDKELPSQGWPVGALTEVLQHQPGLHEWRLLLPALRTCSQQGTVALIGSPHLPHLASLASQGVNYRSIVLIEAHTPSERLWAAEQALRCKDVSALLAWLPQARSDQLRRLQLASANHANGQPRLVFAFRPQAAAQESSAAPLRLVLSQGQHHHLSVDILKRKGPALDKPLQIAAQVPSVLALRSDVLCPTPGEQVTRWLNQATLAPSVPLVPWSSKSATPMRNARDMPIEIVQDGEKPDGTVESSHAVDRPESPRRSRQHRPLALA